MGRRITKERKFEVKVIVAGKPQMKHYDASDHHKAVEKAQRAGYRVISVRKAEEDRLFGNLIQDLQDSLSEEPMNALALEEIAFRRRIRIDNNGKHKEDY